MTKILLPWIDKKNLETRYLSQCEYAISFLKENQERIYWESLSENIGAIDLLRENINKIDWSKLSTNKSIDVIKLLEIYQNWHKRYYYYYYFMQPIINYFYTENVIDIKKLSQNPSAVPFLEK